MVKVEPIEPLNLEDIKSRLRDLQEHVSQLKSETGIRTKSLEMIQQERLFLQQQLIILKAELEWARGQNMPLDLETRVIN